jgi:uncharacterized protein YndB with AHSA1/START domain
MERDIVIEVTYPVAPEFVWRALTEQVLLREWLMENTFRAEVGAHCEFRMPPKPGFEGVVRCEVLEVEVNRRLVYTWDGGGSWGKTTVVWTLEPDPAGTRLQLEHRGFQGFRPFLLSLMMGSGWKKKLTTVVGEIAARLARKEELPA